MKRIAAVAAVAAALPISAAASAPVLGVVGSKIVAQELVRLDPDTLEELPGGLPLAAHKYGWSFSPDRGRLALGSNGRACTERGTELRIVDVDRMQSLGDLRIAAGGAVQASAWLRPNRIVAVVGPGTCGSAAQTRVVAVDAGSGRVVGRTWLRGYLISTARAPGKLVLLLGSRSKIGAARIAVVDAEGTVREKTLEAVPAGQRRATVGRASAVATPGLAADPAGRAFVVSGWDGVTEVDLKTMRVGYHPIDERRIAKGSTSGSERAAVWLGNGLLAVAGSESVNREESNRARTISTTPAGLRIVDTRTWRYRALDPDVSVIQPAGGKLIAHGSTYAYDGRRTTSTFTGLIAYSRGGDELYRVFAGQPIGRVSAIGGRGYATVGGTTYKNRTVSFDLATGRVGRAFDRPLWELLLENDRA